MAPYGRDAGMTESEAERLAAAVRDAGVAHVAVEREGRYFVVVAETSTGRHTLRDAQDWSWLSRQVLRDP